MVVSCEQVWREISNYLDGEVNPQLRAAMEAHFRECRHCTAVLDGTKTSCTCTPMIVWWNCLLVSASAGNESWQNPCRSRAEPLMDG